jgi:hypothetical protein
MARMFDILRLPSQDSHLQDFEKLAAQAVQDGNVAQAEHWESMAAMERQISGSDSAERLSTDRRNHPSR